MGTVFAALALLFGLALPAAAQPLRPALKQSQCPLGYMQSGGYCMPMSRPRGPEFIARTPKAKRPGVTLRE